MRNVQPAAGGAHGALLALLALLLLVHCVYVGLCTVGGSDGRSSGAAKDTKWGEVYFGNLEAIRTSPARHRERG